MENKKDFKPKIITVDEPIDASTLELVSTNTFAFISSVPEIDDSNFLLDFSELLSEIKTKGMVFNYNNDSRDVLAGKIARKFGPLSDVYLPFKAFNKEALVDEDGDEVVPVISEPTQKAYGLSAFYKYKNPKDENGKIKFNELGEFIKKFTARDVHLLMGGKCVTKVKFLMVYTLDDCETTAEIDFKKTGSASFMIKLACELGIPVFNLHKKDRINDLSTYLKTI